MINLGVVVAVSEYTGDAKNLPACREDGAAIAHVLKASGRFDDILHIDTETAGTSVKQRLAEFAKTHKGKEVGEVFFYFTGHGEFIGDEFYYLLTDYQAKKRNQTSLDNSELDGIIRALSPRLFVKIVDACHSGVSYIKTPDDFREYLKSADKKFEKIYFMFSSQSEQFSYQNEKISYFTESILKSIFNHASDTIRYKDVMSYVADEFKEYDFQTPLFVTQADYTEIFCEATPSLKERIGQYIQEAREAAETPLPDATRDRALSTLLRADAEIYCSKEEALNAVSFLLTAIKKRSLPKELSEIFLQEVHAEQNKPPASGAIGRWLEQGKDERKYFARATKSLETYKKRVVKNPFNFKVMGLGVEAEYDFVDAEREVVSGFAFTTEVPFEHIRIRLEPKFPNLAPEECYIVPLVSRTHLRLFWTFSHFEYVDWDKSSKIGKLEWSTGDVLLKERPAIEALIDQIESRFVNFVEQPLKARWGLEASPENADASAGDPQVPEKKRSNL
jgi:hypothetical protein